MSFALSFMENRAKMSTLKCPFRIFSVPKRWNTILKLNKTLYGLQQSPQVFWKYITKKLETCGLAQSKFDPCLFVGSKVICIVYIDGIIFWIKDTADIDSSAMQLRELGVDLE
jgi:hypothetical protein